jgi:hypothetical protein
MIKIDGEKEEREVYGRREGVVGCEGWTVGLRDKEQWPKEEHRCSVT